GEGSILHSFDERLFLVNLGHARAAPGPPKRDDDDLAAVVGELQGLAVEVFAFDLGQGAPGFEVAEPEEGSLGLLAQGGQILVDRAEVGEFAGRSFVESFRLAPQVFGLERAELLEALGRENRRHGGTSGGIPQVARRLEQLTLIASETQTGKSLNLSVRTA